jgi:hypothetical protein
MNRRMLRIILVSATLAAIVALSSPAYAAENAKTTKYGVDLYERPYFDSPVIIHLTYERRVEVIGEPRFHGGWYRISTGLGEGFIFSKYLAIDPGVKIPLDTVVVISKPLEPNATITGDKVNVRTGPADWKHTWGTLDEGTRVEAKNVLDLTDTIDGYTAPWYYIEFKKGLLTNADSGYVFGRYVNLDPRTTVPPLPRSNEWYFDPIERFIQKGLHVFGNSESAIVKKLGRPISITEGKSEYDYTPSGYRIERRLTYPDIVIDIRKDTKTDPDNIYKLSITTGAYEFGGLKVGSTVADVERVLGTPAEKTGESHTYHDSGLGVHDAVFKMRDGVVIEIILDTTYYD